MFLLLAFALASPPASTPDSNTHFSYSLQTSASAATIWAIWTDVSRWQTWDIGLISAEIFGPFEVGARGYLLPEQGPKSSFRLVAVQPGVSYTIRTRLPLGALYVKRTLSVVEGHTQFTHEVWIAGISKPIFSRVLGRKFRAMLPDVLAAIKAQAEQ